MFKTTVDSILKDFSGVISKLESHAARQRDEAITHNTIASLHSVRSSNATNEANRADRLVSKFKELVS